MSSHSRGWKLWVTGVCWLAAIVVCSASDVFPVSCTSTMCVKSTDGLLYEYV